MRVCVHIFVCVSSVVSPPLYGSNRESVNVSLGIDKKKCPQLYGPDHTVYKRMCVLGCKSSIV